MPANHIPLQQLLAVFVGLYIAGLVLTLPLFKFKIRRFVHSSLCLKIAMWVPIFALFLAALYASNVVRLAILASISVVASLEAWRWARTSKSYWLIGAYLGVFLVAFWHFALMVGLFSQLATLLLIVVCFTSVLSDVGAFFFGRYLGKHSLPSSLNSNKNWEGVAGQLVGAALGMVVVNTFIVTVAEWWLFIPLGVGSALGDLANSFVKRHLDIKDWSQNLPGHGGFLDRFASLAFSVMVTFYALLI